MECDFVEKLRRENPEQFFVLVRMHLSFIIDMNTDENDSPTDKPKAFKWGFSKKGKNGCETTNKTTPGGVPTKVTETFNVTESNVNQIYQLIDILADENNVCQEGIFRRTGSLSRQQLLRKLLSSGKSIKDASEGNECAFSVHDMASVLKGILADTPEPLLLNQHYQAYCHLAATCFTDGQLNNNSETRLIGALRLLILLLPTLTWRLTVRLLELLHQTASHEASNRMSPSALATMFTPHVMCPRRLSPESLHTDSQNLQPILSFMIKNAPQIFIAPPQLVTDISAYLTKREQKRLLSPKGEDLNESVTERTAANTVYTFVDRQMSCTGEQSTQNGNKNQAHNTTFTDTALAQLYAHIQALPESQNKRRLIKQFNRENGHGTPLQIQRAQKQKSIGQSLKKHIFNKTLMSKTIKRTSLMQEQGFGYQSIIESPTIKELQKSKTEICSSNDTPKLSEEPEKFKHTNDTNIDMDSNLNKNEYLDAGKPNSELSMTPEVVRRKLETNILMTSTPHVSNVRMNSDLAESCSTPILSKTHLTRRSSMSPITKSTQKMPRAMQESIMTPRSRKPVVISCDPLISSQNPAQKIVPTSDDSLKSNKSYNSFSSPSSSSSVSIKNDSDFVSTDESCPSKSYCIKYKRIKENDYSKQELYDSMNFTENNYPDASKCSNLKAKSYNLDQSVNELINSKLIELSDNQHITECNNPSGQISLTDPFRQYLLCRSILTESPVDLSFNSGPEDYSENDIEIINNLTDNKLTDSLLYCLNGNKPEVSQHSDQENLLENEMGEYKNNNSTLKKINVDVGKSKEISNKRTAQKENEISEAKKMIMSSSEKTDGSNDSKESGDFWNFDRHRILRETNL